jgi:hypothetical protein
MTDLLSSFECNIFTTSGPSKHSQSSLLYCSLHPKLLSWAVQRLFLVFSFQILLAFFWWLSHLSIIHSDSLVLVRLESCIF